MSFNEWNDFPNSSAVNDRISDFTTDIESADYHGCSYRFNGNKVLQRTAKITPKKDGQFVTCWKRTPEGITAPFHVKDKIDCYLIFAIQDNQKGVFVFPQDLLLKKNIMACDDHDGKRGFRVYPPWDSPTSKQAITTQKWQLKYFVETEKALIKLLNLLSEHGI